MPSRLLNWPSAFGLPETVGLELSGKKLGLVGGGQIAQIVADIARAAFHCKLFVYDPFLSAEACEKLGFRRSRRSRRWSPRWTLSASTSL